MNAVSIPGSEEFEVLSPSCIEIVQGHLFEDASRRMSKKEANSNEKIREPPLQEEGTLFINANLGCLKKSKKVVLSHGSWKDLPVKHFGSAYKLWMGREGTHGQQRF
ncbi:hypothetical protein AVEN_268232-1 [Araneus ventricosus]|uniref:Uncharacterized protein n=1 Tax=Araneus ventricosus TaxID=182803 RepID=A0A4Y2IH55_ARAVE|nr:hypothetical protein AVEN_268232-1 [Araneus ventricosus]